MGKKKQSGKWVAVGGGFGTQPMATTLKKAEAMIRRGELQPARAILEPINRQSPDQIEVLRALSEVYYQQKLYYPYFRMQERLYRLKPNNADDAFSCFGAALLAGHPFAALQLLREAQNRWPDHPSLLEAKERGIINKLEQFLEEFRQKHGLPEETALQIGYLNEQAQLLLGSGYADEAMQTVTELVQFAPDFVPGWNNLSTVQFMTGQVDAAIATCETVLQKDADNIHALANRIRYQYLSGRIDAAKANLPQLKAIAPTTVDLALKQAETYTYLGDDQAVWDVYQQAKTLAEQTEVEIQPALHHFAAVAIARLGDLNQARSLWEQALQGEPDFRLAVENLRDSYLPIGDRQGAWPFTFADWTNRKLFDDFKQLLTRSLETTKSIDSTDGFKVDKQLINQLFTTHPELVSLLPILWERGDESCRHLILMIAKGTTNPDIQQLLPQFVISQFGSDAMRMELAQLLKGAGLLGNGLVEMWVQGQLQQLQIKSYEIYDEPSHDHSPKVESLMARASVANRSQKYQQARQLLKTALDLEPEAPDIRYNLGVNLKLTGQEQEGQALIEQVYAEHPSYLFAALAMATRYIQTENLQKAEEILQQFSAQERFHRSEFDMYCGTYVQLAMAKHDDDLTNQWLRMWEQVLPNSRNLQILKTRQREML